MPSHNHRKAQVALSMSRNKAETNRKVTRALGLIRGEANDCWEIVLAEMGVDETTIRHASKKVREQLSSLDDHFIRQESGLFR